MVRLPWFENIFIFKKKKISRSTFLRVAHFVQLKATLIFHPNLFRIGQRKPQLEPFLRVVFKLQPAVELRLGGVHAIGANGFPCAPLWGCFWKPVSQHFQTATLSLLWLRTRLGGTARPQKGHVLIWGLVTLNSKTPFMSLNNWNKEDKISEN